MVSILDWPRRTVLVVLSVGLATALAFWYFGIWKTRIPHRTLRIGFEQNPPVQVRTGTGFAGLAVETVNEAARRAGISLQWIETGTSSDEAFRRGLVDLWPIMADLPDRRTRIHFSSPASTAFQSPTCRRPRSSIVCSPRTRSISYAE